MRLRLAEVSNQKFPPNDRLKGGSGPDGTGVGPLGSANGVLGSNATGGNGEAEGFPRRYNSDQFVETPGLAPQEAAGGSQKTNANGTDTSVPQEPPKDGFEFDTRLAEAKAATAAAQQKVDGLQAKVTELEAKLKANPKGAADDLKSAKDDLAKATQELQEAKSAEKVAMAAAAAARNSPISKLLTQADQEISAGVRSTSAAEKASHFVGANRALKAAAERIKADPSTPPETQRDYSARVKASTDLFMSDPDNIRNQLLESDKKQVDQIRKSPEFTALPEGAARDKLLDQKFRSSLDDYQSSIEALKPYNRDLYGTDKEKIAQQQKRYGQQRTAGVAEIVLNGFSQGTQRVKAAGSTTPNPIEAATGNGLRSKAEERKVATENDAWPAFADGSSLGTNDKVVELLESKSDDVKRAAKNHNVDGRAIAGAIYLEGRANLDWNPNGPKESARSSFAGFGTQHEVSLKVMHPEMTDKDLARAKLHIGPSIQNIAEHLDAKATVREKLSGVSTRNDPVMLAADYQRSETALVQSAVRQYRNIALGREVNFVIGRDASLGGQDMGTGIQMIQRGDFNATLQTSARITPDQLNRFKPDSPVPTRSYSASYKVSN